ncbi:hypothetical protein Hanom_Chr02g00129281 [Helianthus anomalus]
MVQKLTTLLHKLNYIVSLCGLHKVTYLVTNSLKSTADVLTFHCVTFEGININCLLTIST